MENIIEFDEILLPKKGVDLTKWAVVACDQFTSNPSYWLDAERISEGAYSTLNLILPECRLGEDNSSEIKTINSCMERYLNEDIFETVDNGMILNYRETSISGLRKGLVCCINLDFYSFEPSEKAPIRSTEGTVRERIPPRLKIRKDAPLELPHILMLIDDPSNSVFLEAERQKRDELYNIELSQNGGRLQAFRIANASKVREKIMSLISKDSLIAKYGSNDDKFLMAVGDGNHSLATAKTHWEELKKTLTPAEQKTHPARLALVEIENIYDNGIRFEPIHRICFNTSEDFKTLFKELFAKTEYTEEGNIYTLKINDTVRAVQRTDELLSIYQKENPHIVLDYIHGEQELRGLVVKNKNASGIILPSLNKASFFKAIMKIGVLPKKTFSMGEAWEKKYYVEARKIISRST